MTDQSVENIERSGAIGWASPPPGWFAGARAALSLRTGGVSAAPFDSLNQGRSAGDDPDDVGTNQGLLERALGLPQAPARARLEHGIRCLPVIEGGTYGPCDALLTREPGLPLWLTVADCLPVFLAAGDWIALLHAGWKGLAAGALPAVVDSLASTAGLPRSEVRAWIGPAIQSCCYPVGREVAERFPAEARVEDPKGLRLDLPRAATLAATDAGLLPDRVRVSRACTSCRGDLFFSYRRDGARSGRMAAVFWRV